MRLLICCKVANHMLLKLVACLHNIAPTGTQLSICFSLSYSHPLAYTMCGDDLGDLSFTISYFPIADSIYFMYHTLFVVSVDMFPL